ncbi:MAG: aminoglycoside phosphotransferase family protein [Pseudonocardiaceae bacterium]
MISSLLVGRLRWPPKWNLFAALAFPLAAKWNLFAALVFPACEGGGVLGVPTAVRNKAVALGAGSWLDALPALVAGVSAEWSLIVGEVFENATEAFVAEVTLGDGTAAVLKILLPGREDAARNEIIALRLAGGVGCARLLRSDESRNVLVLERLGRCLHDLTVPIGRRHEILCATARRVWRPAAGCGLPTGADKGRWLAEWIPVAWEETGRPCSARAVDHALACAARRVAAHDDERAVLVHGDVHEWNALEAPEGFKLVDPDGLLAEAEYDLGIVMREDPVELLDGDPYARARSLAARTGLDATTIWEWGVLERVSTGLLATRIDLQPVGRQMLAAADHVAQISCHQPPGTGE